MKGPLHILRHDRDLGFGIMMSRGFEIDQVHVSGAMLFAMSVSGWCYQIQSTWHAVNPVTCAKYPGELFLLAVGPRSVVPFQYTLQRF